VQQHNKENVPFLVSLWGSFNTPGPHIPFFLFLFCFFSNYFTGPLGTVFFFLIMAQDNMYLVPWSDGSVLWCNPL
jgi:hypothetical protein